MMLGMTIDCRFEVTFHGVHVIVGVAIVMSKVRLARRVSAVLIPESEMVVDGGVRYSQA